MCLQWCHVTRQIINNDHPCVHCDPDTRFGRIREDCATCRHLRGTVCALTSMPIPEERVCCHHNVEPTPMGLLELRSSEHVAPEVLRFNRARDLEDLFWLVESAPEPKVVSPGVLEVRLEDLAAPFVYGRPANERES